MNPQDFLQSFGLGPRKCEDCGETFEVPPYLECARWKYYTPCTGKRFHAWIKTPDAKKAIEAFEQKIQTTC
jgi:hypothetical protein